MTQMPVSAADRSAAVRATRVVLRHHAAGEVIAYDMQGRRLVHDLTDYSMWLVQGGLSRLTIHQALTGIASFYDYILVQGMGYPDLSDQTILSYRNACIDSAVGLVGAWKRVGPEFRQSAVTINQKLRAVYNWLWWMQDHGRVPDSTIGGDGCQIYSYRVRGRGRGGKSGMLAHCPALFPVRELRPTDLAGRTPSDKQLDALSQYFVNRTDNTYLRERDHLLFRISLDTGFRRDSLVSLRCDQFKREAIENSSSDTFPITPDRQKFSYGNEYSVPLDVAVMILEFIEGPRQAMCEAMGFGRKVTRDAVFVSSRDGMPIQPRSVTKLFSAAMRAVGLPKGCAVHALRRRFADNEICDEIRTRLQFGLDTSSISIAEAVASKLGHRSVESLRRYISVNVRRLYRSAGGG
ncbi:MULTISPECIES: site-specific integrase [unclassified Roseateles]|uniref:site-specific integrase n=1 Tax=unclassified Roseateles TaxID=2626991 RepID=UPI00138F9AEA|nr:MULTISPECIES: site-specific integrase [unclassified Roseateles]